MAYTEDNLKEDLKNKEYEFGFTTNIETEKIPKGLNEDIVKLISKKKNEPEWLLEWRLNAFRAWQKMTPPKWAHLKIPEIDYQDIIYYAAPKTKKLRKLGRCRARTERNNGKIGHLT